MTDINFETSDTVTRSGRSRRVGGDSLRAFAVPYATRLRLSRQRLGLSMRGLAARLDPKVSIQAIGKYETGAMKPSEPVFRSLQSNLQVPEEFLTNGAVAFMQAEDVGTWPRVLKQEIGALEFLLLQGIEYRLAVEPTRPTDPFAPLEKADATRLSEIDAFADALRSTWQVGSGAVNSVRDLMEVHGIHVVDGDLPELFGGSAYRAVLREPGGSVTAVLLTARTCLEHKRMVLASELGRRLVAWPKENRIASRRAWRRFGGAFLVPADDLRGLVGSRRTWISRREILDLKAHYGVPATVLIRRLRETGILRRSDFDRAIADTVRSWQYNEPEPGAAGDAKERGGFVRNVWKAFAEGRISADQAAGFLGRSKEDVIAESEAFGLPGSSES